jgi:hypothetical protein
MQGIPATWPFAKRYKRLHAFSRLFKQKTFLPCQAYLQPKMDSHHDKHATIKCYTIRGFAPPCTARKKLRL